jgi:prepilin-type N-terminal cleavage/methylation domain-containing protein
MRTTPSHPRAASDNERGVTLVEVVVAMMVFAIIAVGVAYALTSTLLMTGDARAREAAANLVAQEVDLDRSVEDVFTLVDGDTTVMMNGTTFHLHRDTNWVTSAGADANCGSGGGQLQYKRVNISVTWDGMSSVTPAVRGDTVIAPGTKINDPTLGTVLVSVLGASGAGSAGVTVTAAPSSSANGAVALTDVPDPTDTQGCSYVLKVTPGNYDVTVSKPNFVDVTQSPTAVTTVGVAAGAAASVAFQYDLAGQFQANYVSNYTSGSTLIPANLDTTYRSTYGNFTSAATTNALSRTVALHPFTAGYEVFAGKYVAPNLVSAGCLSVDPAAWTTPAADGAVGHTPAAVATVPGGSVTVGVPMGVVNVSGLPGKYLKAVSQASAPGTDDPGCAVTMTYLFGVLPASSPAQVALPFGSWLLYYGTAAGTQTTAVPVPSQAVLTRGSVAAPSGIVTLDPRTVVP